MGLFLNQQDQRTKLQEKIIADLQAKQHNSAQNEGQASEIHTDKQNNKSTAISLLWWLAGFMVIVILFMQYLLNR